MASHCAIGAVFHMKHRLNRPLEGVETGLEGV